MPGARKNFIGLEGFIWWIGVVEDRQDPEQLGRVRVRCFGWHTEDKTKIPTEDLPWAQPVIPVNHPGTYTPKEGDMVFGFFIDGENAQHPAIMGVLPGKPEKKPNYENGFSDPRTDVSAVPKKPDDVAEVYPKNKYLKEATNSRLARGVTDGTIISTRKKNRVTSIKSAGGVSWDEPTPPYAAKYPYNNSLETESGHSFELDDSPSAERVQLAHRNGSYIEMDQNGNRAERVQKDNYEVVMGSDYVYIKGSCAVTIGGDCNLKVVGTINVEAAEINMAATGDIKLKAGKAVKVQSGTTTDINAGSTFNLASGKSFNLKSGSSLAIEGASSVGVKSGSGLNIQGGSSVGISSGGATAIQASGGLGLSGSGSVGLSGSSVEVAAPLNVMGPTNLTVSGVTMVASGPGPHIHAIVKQPVTGSGASAGGSAGSAASAAAASDSGLSDPSTGSVATAPTPIKPASGSMGAAVITASGQNPADVAASIAAADTTNIAAAATSATSTATSAVTAAATKVSQIATSLVKDVVSNTATVLARASVGGLISTIPATFNNVKNISDGLIHDFSTNLPINELINNVHNYQNIVDLTRGQILSLPQDLKGEVLGRIDTISNLCIEKEILFQINPDISEAIDDIVRRDTIPLELKIGKHIFPSTETFYANTEIG